MIIGIHIVFASFGRENERDANERVFSEYKLTLF